MVVAIIFFVLVFCTKNAKVSFSMQIALCACVFEFVCLCECISDTSDTFSSFLVEYYAQCECERAKKKTQTNK